ncbi:MAG: PA14 domain-containing protein [Pseudomonadota bacterium]
MVGTLSVVDPDAGDTHSVVVSDDRFEVVDGELRLREGVALDHEEAASIEVEVTVTDSGGLSLTESFTIDVADVNEGPTDIKLNGSSIAENDAGVVVGTLSVVDPDAGDSHSFEVSDDRFEVVNGELRLREGVELDHEEAASIEVEVTVTDSGGLSLTESFTIDVADVNEGPSDVSLAGGTISENAAGVVVGTLSVVDPDAGDTHSFEVSDDRFEVVNGELRLREGVALDYEEAASIEVEVTATDSGGLSLTESFTVDVADVNERASDISLAGDAIAENAAGAVVGTLSVVDPDSGDTHSFEVSDDRFEVVDGELRLREGVALDHEEAASIEVEVTVTDSGGLSLTESFTIDVADVNEGPSDIGLTGGTVAENAAGAVVGTMSVVDLDAGDTHSFEVSDDRFEVVHGELRLREGVALDHEEAATIEVDVTATDSGGLSLTESFMIDVVDVNEGPSDIELTGNTVTENASGAVVGTISVIDPDAIDSHSFEVSDDRFEVSNGELRLREGVALDHEEAASIQVEVTATDSGGLSLSESFTIDVKDVNEGPADIELAGSAVAENAAGAVVGTVSVVDPDAGDTHSFEVSDDRFEVVNGELRLREGMELDHEEAATIDVEVTATDSGGASLTESFTIDVVDVNEGPTQLSIEAPGSPTLSLNENGGTGDVALTSNMADFPTDALTLEMRFQSVDPAPTHGVSLFSYAADTAHNNEFLVWMPKGAEGNVRVFVAGRAYDTGIDAGSILDGEMHDLAVTWDHDSGQLAVHIDGEAEFSRTISSRELHADGTIALGQEQDREGGRYDPNQIFEGRIAEVRLFDHVRSDEEITENAGSDISDPASTQGLLLNWTMDEVAGGVIEDKAGNNDLVLGGDAQLVDVSEPGIGLQVAENAAGAVVGTLSVVDPDVGDSHSFEVSDDRFEVVNGELRLRDGVTLDHEEAATIEIEVTVTDSGGMSLTESFTIDVADVNEGPADLGLAGDTVAENAAGAVVGTISVVDPDAGDSHNFEVSDDRFEVVDGELRLREGVALDHEEAASIEVEVTATDSGGLSLTESFTIDVADVNEGPGDIGLVGSTVAENAAGAVVGNISVVDPDAGDTHSFEVSDDRFEVVDGELRLREGVSLDHEEAATIEVEVTATDSGGSSITESFTIEVADVNEGPSDIGLASSAVAENAAGAVVGTISVVDPDADDSHSFEVSDDRFEVVDGELRLRDGVALDHEEAASIEVEVTATDSGGLSLTESFTIDVADVNEGPSDVSLAGGTIAENAAGAVVGTLSVVDPDAGDSHNFDVSDDRFEVVDGELKLREGVALDHEEAASIEVEVTATDSGGLSLTESFTIEVAEMPSIEIGSGFHAKYFDVDHSLRKIDDIDWSTDPTFEEVTGDINYANGRGSFWEGGSTDTFGVQITGTVEVTEAGSFDFHLGGDDGAVLYVNGQPVIDNDGLHGFRTRSGEIELEPGVHHIEVKYFENYGHAGLRLQWEGPGIEGRSDVMAPEFADTQTVSGVPVAVDITLGEGEMADTAALLIENLPEGTELLAGDNAVVVGPDGSADITGWSTDVLTLRPPVDFVGDLEAAVVVEVQTDAGGVARQDHPLTIEVAEADVSAPDVEIVGGFQASYFDVNQTLRSVDDIDWGGQPTHEEMVSEINYKNGSGSFWEGGSRDTFGVRLEGEVTVEEGGTYKFFAGGDDGVVLYINGEPLIDNDGLHGFRTRSGEIELEPGTYDIEVRYFENYGHAGLRVEWEGPDTDGRELLQADAEMAIEQNGTLNIGLDTGSASEAGSVELTGLPADTILISGEDSMVTDGGSADLSNWDLSVLEISPPPGFEGTVEGDIILTDTAFNGAEIHSVTEFSFSVGDPLVNQDAGPAAMEDISLIASDNMEDRAGWDTLGAEGEDAMEVDDVMSEAPAMPASNDVSDMSIETYERVEL